MGDQGQIEFNDENVLGVHLFSVHNVTDRSHFNDSFHFDILCSTSPDNIPMTEHLFVNSNFGGGFFHNLVTH